MPGIHVPAAAASIFSPAYSFSFDDDDGFGDFKFASSVQPFPSHPPPPPTQQQQQQDDDDWGDFVVSPIGSHPVESPSPPPLFDAFPPLYAAASDKIAGVKQWEKPSGALPLSIFGEEEVDEPEPLHPPVLFSASLSSSIPARDRKGPVAAHGELRDLITSLYGQASQPVGGDNDGLCLAEGKEDDSDESSWEYKDASSSSPNSVLKEDGIRNEKSGLQCTETADFREIEKAYGVASLSGEQIIEMKRKEEIKAVYKKLEEAKGTRNIIRGEHLPVDVYVSQLLKAVEEPNFRAFEQEYHLSERIISAGKELCAAIEFLEHTNSVLCILALASREEQHAYIHAWSAISVACVQELQHGAIILQESVRAQKLMQILFQGTHSC